MIRLNINIENSSIKFCNQKMTIGDRGIFIIKGANGSGKSTVIKDVVFNFKKIGLGNKNFCYVEQEPHVYNCKMIDYIKRYNNEVDNRLVKELLTRFKLEKLELGQPISNLSGGEICRLNIISGLVKESDYIFLDEPSNNLDDETVFELVTLLEEIAEEKAVIIVTHDKRIDNGNYNEVRIQDGIIEVDYDLEEVIEEKRIEKREINYPSGKVIKFFMYEGFRLGISIISALLLAGILFLNSFLFKYFYSTENMPMFKDDIIVYFVDTTFSTLNRRFAEWTGIIDGIDERMYHNAISYDDVKKLSEYEGVEQIVYSDDKYMNEIAERYRTKTLLTKETYLSVPEVLYKENIYIPELPFDIRYLEEGRLPGNGKFEAVLSKKMMQKFFPDINSESAIGRNLKIKGRDYKIVGISNYDLCLVSYSSDMCYGYRDFDLKGYEKYVEEITEYKKNKDYTYVHNPMNLLIRTKKESEKDVLKDLMTDYPANNYYSYSYALEYKKAVNVPMVRNTVFINIGIAIACGMILLLFGNKRMVVWQNLCRVYDGYYLCLGKTKKMLIWSNVISDIILGMSFFAIAFILKIQVEIALIMLMDTILIMLPYHINSIVVKKYD